MSYGNSILNFLRNHQTVFNSDWYQSTFPPSVNKGSLFSTTSATLVITHLFDNSHSNRCEVVCHCSLDLHFPNC